MQQLNISQNRHLTRRGVLWLGLRCDVRCKFCYDERVSKADKLWVPLEDVKRALNKFRTHYQNEFVDFMGGEPTLHPQILEIVKHASSIGLRPTLITHAMHLSRLEKAVAFKEAGVHDFLISIHGVGDTVAAIHGRDVQNYERQLQALENLKQIGIAARFNCILIKDNLEELSQIVDLAIEKNVKVINFLTFNPYFEWTKDSEIEFQARHSEIVRYLIPALQKCEQSNIEANVRYMPICQLKGYEKHAYTGYQLPYDTHEWDYNSWYDQGHAGQPHNDWYLDASNQQKNRHSYEHVSACQQCAVSSICDGFQKQYITRWGGGEARPYSGEKISNPVHFIQDQKKYEYSYKKQPMPSTQEAGISTINLSSITQFKSSEDNRAGVIVGLPSTRRT